MRGQALQKNLRCSREIKGPTVLASSGAAGGAAMAACARRWHGEPGRLRMSPPVPRPVPAQTGSAPIWVCGVVGRFLLRFADSRLFSLSLLSTNYLVSLCTPKMTVFSAKFLNHFLRRRLRRQDFSWTAEPRCTATSEPAKFPAGQNRWGRLAKNTTTNSQG